MRSPAQSRLRPRLAPALAFGAVFVGIALEGVLSDFSSVMVGVDSICGLCPCEEMSWSGDGLVEVVGAEAGAESRKTAGGTWDQRLRFVRYLCSVLREAHLSA